MPAAQVANCALPLDGPACRAYNLRYRVCMLHLRADLVEMDGQAMRFCQKCSRFEPVSAFRVRTRAGEPKACSP